MGKYLATEIVLDALDMLIRQRKQVGVIHHSDQSSHYISLAFGKCWRGAEVRAFDAILLTRV